MTEQQHDNHDQHDRNSGHDSADQHNSGNDGSTERHDQQPDPAAQLKDMQTRLDSARRLAARQDAELTRLKQGQMNEAERAIEQARSEGRAEAVKAAGQRLAAAEFRAKAAGKLPDPAVLIETLDLAKFVDEDGEPNVKLIESIVDKLATAMNNGKRTAPTVPGGPRPDAPDTDWLRQAMSGKA